MSLLRSVLLPQDTGRHPQDTFIYCLFPFIEQQICLTMPWTQYIRSETMLKKYKINKIGSSIPLILIIATYMYVITYSNSYFYLFEFIFVLEFNYLRGHREKSCIIVLKIHNPLYNSQFIYQLMQYVCICSTTSKHRCKT